MLFQIFEFSNVFLFFRIFEFLNFRVFFHFFRIFEFLNFRVFFQFFEFSNFRGNPCRTHGIGTSQKKMPQYIYITYLAKQAKRLKLFGMTNI